MSREAVKPTIRFDLEQDVFLHESDWSNQPGFIAGMSRLSIAMDDERKEQTMPDSIAAGDGQQPDLSKMMSDKEAAERVRVIVTETASISKNPAEIEQARIEQQFQLRLFLHGLIEEWGYAETAKEWRKTW